MNTLVKLDFSSHISPPDVFRLLLCVKKKNAAPSHTRTKSNTVLQRGGGEVYIENNTG